MCGLHEVLAADRKCNSDVRSIGDDTCHANKL